MYFAVTTGESVEQTTPTNLPNTIAMTTDGETTSPPMTPLIELACESDSQVDLSRGKLFIEIIPMTMNMN